MYAKKIAFSFFTVPALGKQNFKAYICLISLVLTHQAYEFQMRRKLDKENDAKRR
jgi:hypothetical protein